MTIETKEVSLWFDELEREVKEKQNQLKAKITSLEQKQEELKGTLGLLVNVRENDLFLNKDPINTMFINEREKQLTEVNNMLDSLREEKKTNYQTFAAILREIQYLKEVTEQEH